MNKESKDTDDKKQKENVATNVINSEKIQRYGEANSEFFKAYSGVDNQSGTKVKRGLKDISKSKLNPEYIEANIAQQSGFSGELLYTAKENAKNIINKQNIRVSNTDTDDSGGYNQISDHIVNNNGQITYEQMKFLKNPKTLVEKALSAKYEKYFFVDNITVQSNFFELECNGKTRIQNEIDRKRESILKKLASEKLSDDEKSKQTSLLNKLESLQKKIKNSGVSEAEARDARLHPELATAKYVASISHSAGIEAANSAALISGVNSVVKNLDDVISKKITTGEAIVNVGSTMAFTYVNTYGKTSVTSAAVGYAQNSKNVCLRKIALKSAPLISLATLAFELGPEVKKYFNGEISGDELSKKVFKCGLYTVLPIITGTAGFFLAQLSDHFIEVGIEKPHQDLVKDTAALNMAAQYLIEIGKEIEKGNIEAKEFAIVFSKMIKEIRDNNKEIEYTKTKIEEEGKKIDSNIANLRSLLKK